MKKILFSFTGMVLLMGGYLAGDLLSDDESVKPVQYHETIDTNVQEKDYTPATVPETTVQQEETEQPFDPAKRFEEVEQMTQEERAALSQSEKDMFGISDDGRFYTETGSSEEQIDQNN